LILVFTRFSRKWTQDLAQGYDLRNVTPCDYSLFIALDSEQDRDFNEQFYNPHSETPRGEQFKAWLTRNMALFSQDAQVTIMRIDLVIENKKMLALLKERGWAIRSLDFERIRELEDEIHAGIEDQYEARICGAFVMFENRHQVANAISICNADERCKVHRSSEPSDYLWDNLGTSK